MHSIRRDPVGVQHTERTALAPNPFLRDAPEVPTLKEQGFDVQFVNWRGFFGPPNMSNADKKKIAKMLGDVQKTPEWETVRKRNAWVNIYNPGSKFDSFLKKQTKEMTKLMKKLGVI